jgi:hypothetical protein
MLGGTSLKGPVGSEETLCGAGKGCWQGTNVGAVGKFVGNSASLASVPVDSASMFIVSRIQLFFEFVVEKLWVFLISAISGNRMGAHAYCKCPEGRPYTPRSLNS